MACALLRWMPEGANGSPYEVFSQKYKSLGTAYYVIAHWRNTTLMATQAQPVTVNIGINTSGPSTQRQNHHRQNSTSRRLLQIQNPLQSQDSSTDVTKWLDVTKWVDQSEPIHSLFHRRVAYRKGSLGSYTNTNT